MTPLIIYERPLWARVTWALAFWALLIGPASFLLCVSLGVQRGFSNLILVFLPLCALITLIGAGRLWQRDRMIRSAPEVMRADALGIHLPDGHSLRWQDFSRVRRVAQGNMGTIYQILQHPTDEIFAEVEGSRVFGDFDDLADAIRHFRDVARSP